MKNVLLTASAAVLFGLSARAQTFVYTPKNPALGGNTFNYQWMLSSATAQDTYKDPAAIREEQAARDPVADFQANLQRQLLSRLSRNLLDRQFGEEELEEGTFQFGELTVEISEGTDGVTIRIVDGQGGESTVTVPFF